MNSDNNKAHKRENISKPIHDKNINLDDKSKLSIKLQMI